MEETDDLVWWTSSFTGGGANCVEVAKVEGGRVVRNSKRPDGPAVYFTDGEWDAFIKGAKAGEFD